MIAMPQGTVRAGTAGIAAVDPSRRPHVSIVSRPTADTPLPLSCLGRPAVPPERG